MNRHTLTTDILVIGGGLAAATAVKRAAEQGVQVCQVVKGRYGQIGQAGAGASACGASEAGSPRAAHAPKFDDEAEHLFHLILHAGLGTVDRALARAMVEDFPKIRHLLNRWNIAFHQPGPYHLGYPLVHGIEQEVRTSDAITLIEQTMIVDLLVEDGRCVGAVGVNDQGDILEFQAAAVILATGGDAQLFKHNVHPACVTGDGYAMGFRAGAHLMNMEFMQIFFCTVHPTRNLFHAWHQDELTSLYNAEHHQFLPDYLPSGVSVEQCLAENIRHAPFSTRDAASRYLGIGIVKEIQAGRGSEHDGVYVDLTGRNVRMPADQRRFLKERGIELDKHPIEITMGHQCSNGGLRITPQAMTTIPGLFAAGEVTTGMHGADRLGGNMLSCCLVFGARAAESAVTWARQNAGSREAASQVAQAHSDQIKALRASSGRSAPGELHRTLRQSAWDHALTVRSAAGLSTFLADLAHLRDAYASSLAVTNAADLIAALELKNLLLVGELVATAALKRAESRGGHYREDFPAMTTDTPVSAVVIHQQGQQLAAYDEVIDPEWQENETQLALERWG